MLKEYTDRIGIIIKVYVTDKPWGWEDQKPPSNSYKETEDPIRKFHT